MGRWSGGAVVVLVAVFLLFGRGQTVDGLLELSFERFAVVRRRGYGFVVGALLAYYRRVDGFGRTLRNK